MLVAAAALGGAACASSAPAFTSQTFTTRTFTSPDTTRFTFPTTSVSREPDEGCAQPYGHRLTVPVEFRLVLVACETRDGMAGTITNTTKAVIRLQPQPGSAAVTWRETASDTLAEVMTRTAVGLGPDASGGFLLGSKATVTVSATVPGGPQLTASVVAGPSVVSFAANYVDDLLSRLKTPASQALLTAGVGCVKGVQRVVTSLRGPKEDFVNAFLDAIECKTIIKAFRDAVPAATEEIVKAERVFGPDWGELVEVVGKAITFVR